MSNLRRVQRTFDFDESVFEADTAIYYPDGTREFHGLRHTTRGRIQEVEETADHTGWVAPATQPAPLPTPMATPVTPTWRGQLASDIAQVQARRGLTHREYPALPPGD